ncbi:DUF3048 domain-containing protein [Streptomyces sp. S.PB5]|uniref:DUF3048 domain-containing protein n=1 Tax=Streptomyces sp. S.PB5 TaxID=3020844 RepID=UPI0025AF4532|nr:DUF3048 domain-containing protein [Streptomyces sp. S.PB5]MDN3025386.1 DUF3048 domain-containing protein [Streptomyces sp. S.PB5]
MGRRARTRRATTTAALLAAALTVSLAAGCTGTNRPGPVDDGRGATQDGNESQDAGRDPGQDPGGAPSQSGLSGESVLAVKIDNVRAARPHTGTDSADIVYTEQVEGGLSRLMAVYATKLPKVIGPVRSARESDLELLRQFDNPTLAFSGAQGKLMPLIDKAPINPQTPGKTSGAYFRGTGKAAPHNLYLHPSRLLPKAPGADALTTGFTYGSAPSGGRKDTSETVRYPAATYQFTWSSSRDRYLVSMDGTAAVTTAGKRIAAATVVVQYVKIRKSAFHDFLGNNTPYTETVGSGKAKVLRGGKAYDVDWEREKATDGTTFTTGDGEPVNFAEGQVWVLYVKA